MIATLHHITQNLADVSHATQALSACQGGARWVQLRAKDTRDDEWLCIAHDVKNVCDTFNAVCIINDNVYIAKAIGADGVHLGKEDMNPDEARAIIGDDKIIGGSANTLDDIHSLAQTSVDYIGIGPFRFTHTKSKLNPILGLEKLKDIMYQVRTLHITIPLIAIGGITLQDVEDIMDTGVHGIALSSAINLSADATFTTSAFIQKIYAHATTTNS